jgi:hypothetical protein
LRNIPYRYAFLEKISKAKIKAKQSRYTPWWRLGGEEYSAEVKNE